MQPPPKGDINLLWNLLGVDFTDEKVVWQDYNPYPKMPVSTRTRSSCSSSQGVAAATKEAVQSRRRPISSGLQQMLFPFPGAVDKQTHFDAEIHPAGRDRRADRHGPLRRPDGDVAVRAARHEPDRQQTRPATPTSWPRTSRAR